MAQWSKFIVAPSRNEFCEPQEGVTLSGATITPQPKSYLILTSPLSRAPRSKSPFSAEGPNENHLSVIFLISPLCFLAGVLPYLCFQDSLYKTSPLVCAFAKSSPSSFTLRCLNSLPSHCPTVGGRWWDISVGFNKVGLILLTIYLVLQIALASFSEGGGKA